MGFESVLLPRHSEAVRRSNPHLSSSHNTTHFVGLVLCKRRGLRILRFAQNDKTARGLSSGRPKAAPTQLCGAVLVRGWEAAPTKPPFRLVILRP